MTWQGYSLGQNIFLNLNFEPRKAVCEEIESRHGFFCSIIQTVFISRTLLLHPHLVAPLFTSPLPPLSPASDWLPYLHLTWHFISSLPRLSHDPIRQLSAQHCGCLCLTVGVSGNTQFLPLDEDCSCTGWKGILLLMWLICWEVGRQGTGECISWKAFPSSFLYHIYFHQTNKDMQKMRSKCVWHFWQSTTQSRQENIFKGKYTLFKPSSMCFLQISCYPFRGQVWIVRSKQGALVSNSQKIKQGIHDDLSLLGLLERALVICYWFLSLKVKAECKACLILFMPSP